TSLPSVTGEGEAKLLFSSRPMPTPVSCCQSVLPVARSRHSAWSVPACWSTELTKTRPSQITGVAAEGPGRSATHFTFSVFEKRGGRPFSVVEPLKKGPRHCGQFSASNDGAEDAARPPSMKSRANIFLLLFIIFSCARHRLKALIRVIPCRLITGCRRQHKADSGFFRSHLESSV